MNENIINEETITTLRQYAPIAENAGRLQPEQLAAIYKQRWFKLFVPEAYGGLALSLPEGLRLEEELARIDGSLGWTVTLCSGATLFIGYLQNDIAKEIFADAQVCFGGSGAINGTAAITEEGYIINGFWKYATGAPHTTIFTANCKIIKDGKALLNEDGTPVYYSFFFKREEVSVLEDWNTMGLKATASYSFEVVDLPVNKSRAFTIDAAQATINSPIYKFPFLQMAETTLAVNTLGMTAHFIDECKAILQKKIDTKQIAEARVAIFEKAITNAENYLQKIKEQFYLLVDNAWEKLVHQNKIEDDLLVRVSCICKSMVKEARDIVTHLYPYCGLAATQNGTTINRVFRDIFTASQHSLLTY